MKNFIKNILSSCLGSLAALIIVFGLFFVLMIGMISFFSDMSNFQSSAPTTGDEVLFLELRNTLPELTNNEEVSFTLSGNVIIGTQDIIRLLSIAKEDKNIQGIVLEPSIEILSYATVGTIREAINNFKESGKFVYAYSNYMSQKNYYLASVADSVFLNPNGNISFDGMGLTSIYFKNTLDKLDIQPEIYYVGDFKSATEPLRRTDMSEEDRLQKKNYLNTMFYAMLDDISNSRNISAAELKNISDNALIRNAENALEKNLIDGLMYSSDFNRFVKDKLGHEDKDKLTPYSLQAYYNSHKSKLLPRKGETIAIIYAEGAIREGVQGVGSITNDQYVKLLRELKTDDDIKGVILRVNSPGGSALVSDNIWYEIENLKAAGKKVVVSMGTYAASGGYYISCNADYIFAEPTTLTGSIGVFGVMLNTGKFFNNKLGITFDTVQTGRFTNSFTPFIERSEDAKDIIQASVNEIYEKFLQRVATGRDMPLEEVAEIAQGHVYSGIDALSIGLVDGIGNLQNAVDKMAELLEIDSYRIKEYPEVKSPIEQFLKQLSGQDVPDILMKSKLPSEYQAVLKQLESIHHMQGVQAKLPYMIVD